MAKGGMFNTNFRDEVGNSVDLRDVVEVLEKFGISGNVVYRMRLTDMEKVMSNVKSPEMVRKIVAIYNSQKNKK
jgi:ribosomal protein S28E/S33